MKGKYNQTKALIYVAFKNVEFDVKYYWYGDYGIETLFNRQRQIYKLKRRSLFKMVCNAPYGSRARKYYEGLMLFAELGRRGYSRWHSKWHSNSTRTTHHKHH